MEKAAHALLIQTRDIAEAMVTRETIERLIRDKETPDTFIRRNAVHLSAMAIGNSAGESGLGAPVIMEAFGTAVAMLCAGQGPRAASLLNGFLLSLSDTLEGYGLRLALLPDDADGADAEKESVQ